MAEYRSGSSKKKSQRQVVRELLIFEEDHLEELILPREVQDQPHLRAMLGRINLFSSHLFQINETEGASPAHSSPSICRLTLALYTRLTFVDPFKIYSKNKVSTSTIGSLFLRPGHCRFILLLSSPHSLPSASMTEPVPSAPETTLTLGDDPVEHIVQPICDFVQKKRL